MITAANPRREGHLFPYQAARRQHVVNADYRVFIASLDSLLIAGNAARPMQVPSDHVQPSLESSVALSNLALFAKLDHGSLSSMLERAVQATTYLIGNPVLTRDLFGHEPMVGQYVPLRIYVVASDLGTLVSYDLPSTSLGQFQSPQMTAVAALLDAKLYELVLDASELAEAKA